MTCVRNNHKLGNREKKRERKFIVYERQEILGTDCSMNSLKHKLVRGYELYLQATDLIVPEMRRKDPRNQRVI